MTEEEFNSLKPGDGVENINTKEIFIIKNIIEGYVFFEDRSGPVRKSCMKDEYEFRKYVSTPLWKKLEAINLP